jgi:hypothetical protein
MRKGRLAAGAMIFALIGFAAEAGLAQGAFPGQGQQVIEDDFAGGQYQDKGGWPGGSGQCLPPQNPPKGGQCYNPPPPVCPQSDCPDGQCSPPIKPGECWSQCIIPAKFRIVSKPVATCQPCATPGVHQNGHTTVSKEVLLRTPSHGYKIPASNCGKQQVAGQKWVKVADAEYGKMKIKKCIPHKEQTLWPSYRSEPRQLAVPYTKPVGLPGQMETAWITVPAQSSWEHLYRKATPCPPNGSGMTDCSAVCSEIKPGKRQRIRISRCKDKGCRFTQQTMPPVVVSYNVEIGIPPQLPPPAESCRVDEITVMTKPPVYQQVDVMESVCESGKPLSFPVPGKRGMVTAKVPSYAKTCKPNAPVYDCVQQKVQACKPVMVWRQEAICQDDGKSYTSLIGQVQTALIQAGYPAGPADGALHEQTKQAIWKFQEDKGLAVGGTLTKETLEALGIYQ